MNKHTDHFSSAHAGSKRSGILTLSVAALLGLGVAGAQAQQFWRTDGTSGTWTGSNWSAAATPAGGTAYVANSNVQFTADSTVTFASISIGNVTVADNKTVTITSAGTVTTNSSVRTFDIGTGAVLNWAGQSWTTTAGIGFIKNGAGTWNIGAQGNALNATNGGFTLNNGTVIVGGNNSFGGSASVLTITGGTIQSSGTRAYANSSIVIGGNFTNSGTGNATFSGTVGLGAATRTLTNSMTSGSRIYSGIISGTVGSGLTFDGAGAGVTYIGNVGNTFTGTVSVNGSEVGFASSGAFGNAANTISIDGGRLTAATTAGAGTSYTLASTHGIRVGTTAGTAISVLSTGTLTYDGVIGDKTTNGSWAKQGGGTLALGGVSTYSGDTVINTGTVQLTTGNDRLPTGTTASLGQAASANLGTLDLNGRDQQLAGLNSTTGTNATASNNTVTSAAAATLTIGGSGTYSYGDGTNANSGVISGAISLVKTGAGTQKLGDANTFTGSTLISNGTLEAAGAGALGSATTGTSGITVNSGGTLLLSGSSSVTDRIKDTAPLNLNGNVADASGIVTFGTGGLSEGAAGTIGIGALTLTTNSIIDFGSGASVIEFAGGGTYTIGSTLFITNWSGNAINGNGTDRLLFSATPDSGLVNNIQFSGFAAGQNAVLSFDSGAYYEIVPVPEPSFMAVAMGLLGLVGYRERRKGVALRRSSRLAIA